MKILSKLFCLCLLSFSSLVAAESKLHEIDIVIKIQCPMSEEFQDFVKSIPASDKESVDFVEWQLSFINNMTALIDLVESGKVGNACWSVNTDEDCACLK